MIYSIKYITAFFTVISSLEDAKLCNFIALCVVILEYQGRHDHLQVNEFFMQEKMLFKFLQNLPYLKHIFNENNVLLYIYESSIKSVKVA